MEWLINNIVVSRKKDYFGNKKDFFYFKIVVFEY